MRLRIHWHPFASKNFDCLSISRKITVVLCIGVVTQQETRSGGHTMNTLSKWLALSGLLTGTVFGQVPSTNDTSDGNFNTGMGTGALGLTGSDVGDRNTASGYEALYSNGVGYSNTADGTGALYANSTGDGNTAIGDGALGANTGGLDNTAVGAGALSGSDADFNVAVGVDAGETLSTGYDNTALGSLALRYASTGSFNIAVGYEAGYNIKHGSYNIDIGSKAVPGDGQAIRIGTEGQQTRAFVAGIYNVTTATAGLPVLVDSAGQLGTVSSSKRFKTDITPMGPNTAKLQQLRPVTFYYKTDTQRTLRYGLIAEEVAKVYPELVVRDQNGRIDGVRYDELAPMLLNEVQKQEQRAVAQDAEISVLRAQLAEMHAALTATQIREQVVAQR